MHLLQYLLKFSITLGLVYLFYALVLRKMTFYYWNRFYLASHSLFCFLIPFINISPLITRKETEGHFFASPVMVVDHIASGITGPLSVKKHFLLIYQYDLTFLVFLAGVIFMSAKVVMKYLSLRNLKRTARRVKVANVFLFDINHQVSPFSFGNSIFYNSRLHTQPELKEIIRHEFIHIKQNHTLDILLGELLCIFNWFNPFAWLIRKAMRQNLEYMADQGVLKSGLDSREYQYLLLKVIGLNGFSIANHFNLSSLKKRIAMMNKIKTSRVHLLKFLFIMPLIAFLLIAFRSKPARQQENTTSIITAQNIMESFLDTIPPPVPVPSSPSEPPPPPPPAPGPPPAPPKLPAEIRSIHIKNKSALVTMQNGKTEIYDLSRPDQKSLFEKKYGKPEGRETNYIDPVGQPENIHVDPVDPIDENPEVQPFEPIQPVIPINARTGLPPSAPVKAVKPMNKKQGITPVKPVNRVSKEKPNPQ